MQEAGSQSSEFNTLVDTACSIIEAPRQQTLGAAPSPGNCQACDCGRWLTDVWSVFDTCMSSLLKFYDTMPSYQSPLRWIA